MRKGLHTDAGADRVTNNGNTCPVFIACSVFTTDCHVYADNATNGVRP